MIDLLRSEWFKLRTLRLNWVLVIIGFVFVVAITVLYSLLVDVDEAPFESGFSGELASTIGVSAVLAGLLVSVI